MEAQYPGSGEGGQDAPDRSESCIRHHAEVRNHDNQCGNDSNADGCVLGPQAHLIHVVAADDVLQRSDVQLGSGQDRLHDVGQGLTELVHHGRKRNHEGAGSGGEDRRGDGHDHDTPGAHVAPGHHDRHEGHDAERDEKRAEGRRSRLQTAQHGRNRADDHQADREEPPHASVALDVARNDAGDEDGRSQQLRHHDRGRQSEGQTPLGALDGRLLQDDALVDARGVIDGSEETSRGLLDLVHELFRQATTALGGSTRDSVPVEDALVLDEDLHRMARADDLIVVLAVDAASTGRGSCSHHVRSDIPQEVEVPLHDLELLPGGRVETHGGSRVTVGVMGLSDDFEGAVHGVPSVISIEHQQHQAQGAHDAA